MKPEEMRILVVENGFAGYWGRGSTLEEALENARKPKYYTAYIATPDTYVTSGGGLSYPSEMPPHAFIEKRPKAKKPKTSTKAASAD